MPNISRSYYAVEAQDLPVPAWSSSSRSRPSMQPPAFDVDGYELWVASINILKHGHGLCSICFCCLYILSTLAVSLRYLSLHIRALVLFVDRAPIYTSVDRTLLNAL